MNQVLPCLFVVVCAAVQPLAHAAKDQGAEIGSFGIGVGTNGIGLDYAYGINRFVDVRVGYDFGSLSSDREEEGIDYDAKLKFDSGRVLIDVKPFAGGFRLSGGLYTGAPNLGLRASGQEEDLELGDREYNLDGDVRGGIDFGGTAPYVGIGWGGTANGTGFGASFDMGVILTGAPKVGLRVPAGFACDTDLSGSDCDPRSEGIDVNGSSEEAVAFRAAVEAERQDLEDDIGNVKFWPVFRLALHYRF